ncbi:DUF3141 domain-containing protein [Pararobbsia silviterrae]|uniref:DUF3141 domain-containing protein n=1 Tax=Pararobbsia silviterrae TaxID=1792498 RepID=A0A494XJ72_9BURK|nr:DUF3141 domain-containing protein [Pararobbsia silviterrae]RKP49761.1 DUF3141 domain-containing protein [Pararobbsia silviterrae]
MQASGPSVSAFANPTPEAPASTHAPLTADPATTATWPTPAALGTLPEWPSSHALPALTPWGEALQTWGGAAAAYAIDAWQRRVLYADVMRERGNQYREHLAERVPNVLDFEVELVLDGRTLPRPVNYGLVRIVAPADLPVDPAPTNDPGRLRPFVVFDPRAGHGPGIGGFKRDSEIGAALRAGHPCYFVGFLPDPVPGQTVEDVMRAEAAFMEKVIELHPASPARPAVIGNCQAGWQVLMTAAMRPDLFGPIIVAGAPVSYWAGWRGMNPMRYTGGLLGGTWLTALTSDLGDGRFDGAWLVQNFENLNPANTLWQKQYTLYANVDTEAPRYLGFEKYWGGHVYLNGVEMQYIADNLFVGNKLTSNALVLSDGTRLDLRKIVSPIVVFCSYGDNITPPPQALGWITDLYADDDAILDSDRTIVYATHDSIGHLGIFVSSSTGRKEHREFVSNIDLIDMLPAGLYEAHIGPKTEATEHAELVQGDHVLSITRRGIDDVRAIVSPDPESDRRFATAARVSALNLALYRGFVQPWVRAFTTPWSASAASLVHPLRVQYETWSDLNPVARGVAQLAEQVREKRMRVDDDNPFVSLEHAMSDAIVNALDAYRDARDAAYESTFEFIYGQPWLQALAGTAAPSHAAPDTGAAARAASVRHDDRVLHAEMTQGGLAHACVRAMLFIRRERGETDERRFNLARELLAEISDRGILSFKSIVREQAALLRLDADAAIAALPRLLENEPHDAIRHVARSIDRLGTTLELDAHERADLARVLEIFETAAKRKPKAVKRADEEKDADAS